MPDSPDPDFTPEQLEYLERYGFDQTLFASWRRDVAEGRLCEAANKVPSELHVPADGTVANLPRSDSDEARELAALGEDAIRRGEFGMVVLNGGMATRFGGVVKGVVDVLGEGRSFLSLRCQDLKETAGRLEGKIPLLLMNSFATEEATKDHFFDHRFFGLDPESIHHFNQFVSVRMTAEGGVLRTADGELSPHGPGHGDFAPALRASGCLERFREAGGKYLFVSNVDNLGARISPVVLGHHIQAQAEATVELAPKWPGDVGGAPFDVDGKVQLIEQIRYPDGFDADVIDSFNTNTFTFSADALDRDFPLGWYYVEKKVEDQTAIQVERLIGELTRFLTSSFLRVRRSGPETRFLPIKTPDDLEAAREEIQELYDGTE